MLKHMYTHADTNTVTMPADSRHDTLARRRSDRGISYCSAHSFRTTDRKDAAVLAQRSRQQKPTGCRGLSATMACRLQRRMTDVNKSEELAITAQLSRAPQSLACSILISQREVRKATAIHTKGHTCPLTRRRRAADMPTCARVPAPTPGTTCAPSCCATLSPHG